MVRREFLSVSIITSLAILAPRLFADVNNDLYEGHLFSNNLEAEVLKTLSYEKYKNNQYSNSTISKSILRSRVENIDSTLFRAVANESSSITIDSNIANDSPTIISIFLYGGPSELAGNLSNLDDINRQSQNIYPTRGITKTKDDFWQEAGGSFLQKMVDNGDATVFRTCKRRVMLTKSHGECISSNLRGTTLVGAPGIAANIAYLYNSKGFVVDDAILPFVTMEGDSIIHYKGDLDIPINVLASPVGDNLENPYALTKLSETTQDEHDSLVQLALLMSPEGKIRNSFLKAQNISDFIIDIQDKSETLPEGVSFLNDTFGKRLKTAANIAIHNPDTKFISVGGGGFGGWDMHSNAISTYTPKINSLFSGISSMIDFFNTVGRDDIIVQVFGDFGRNVNLNNSGGWDHGDNQNFYVFGGKKFLNHKGVVGSTVVVGTGSNNRLYTEPTTDSYEFDPLSIAAFNYKIMGINDPNYELTAEQAPINPNSDFLK